MQPCMPCAGQALLPLYSSPLTNWVLQQSSKSIKASLEVGALMMYAYGDLQLRQCTDVVHQCVGELGVNSGLACVMCTLMGLFVRPYVVASILALAFVKVCVA